MQKRKIKPGSFQDRAESKAVFKNYKQIDLRKLWRGDDDIELSPQAVDNAQVQNKQVS